MSYKSPKELVKLLLLSFLATLLGVVFAMVVATYIPISIDLGDDDSAGFIRKDVYSREELDRADAVFKEKLERYKQQDKNRRFVDITREMKNRGIWISWIPWFFLPFIFSQKQYLTMLILIILPFLLVFTGLTLPLEIFTFSLAMFLGIYLTRKRRQRV